MATEKLSVVLEREHRAVDEGIAAYLADESSGRDPLDAAFDALRRHIYLEEELVFPHLPKGGLVMALMVMIRQHGGLWGEMGDTEKLLDDGADRSEIVARLTSLQGQLDQHNDKEEPVVYPQADEAVTGEAAEKLDAFRASGSVPDGWLPESLRPKTDSPGGKRLPFGG